MQPTDLQAVRSAAARCLRGRPDGLEIHPILAGASTRTFWRARDVAGASVVVIMGTDSGTDYLARPEQHWPELPFVMLGRLLERIGIPTSNILLHDEASGAIVVRDLGDLQLLAALEQASPRERQGLLGRAVSLIECLQRHTAAACDWLAPLAGRRLDRDTLLWEFQHYFEWGLRRRYHGCDARALAEVEAELADVCDELAATGSVLTHRDLHARNLMVTPDGHVAVIDFQDILIANPLYDLASLLYDGYSSRWIDDATRHKLLVRAYTAMPALSGLSLAAVERLLALQGIQRALKAVGRFGWLAEHQSKPGFIDHQPGSLAIARRLLWQHGQLAPLAHRLAAVEPRLARM